MVMIPVKIPGRKSGYQMAAESSGPAMVVPREPATTFAPEAPENLTEETEIEPAEPVEPAEDRNPEPDRRVAELKAAYDRLFRDFANYKRHAEADQARAETTGQNELVRLLIPVLSDLTAAANASGDDADAVRRGVALIRNKLEAVLEHLGYVRIPTDMVELDPRIHEAVALVQAAGVPDGQVINELSPGYQRDGKLVQPARVVVAKDP